MTHLYVIVVLISLHLAGGWAGGMMPQSTPGWAVWALVVTPHVVICVLAGLVTVLCKRSLDRRGDARAVGRAHRALLLSRLLAMGWHVASVFVLGVLGLVRRWTGDLVLVDELLAAIPAIALLLWTFRLAHPIELRVRAAVMMRDLDEGRPVYAFPSPWGYVLSAVRNNLAIMALPLVLILGWAEVLDRIVAALGIVTDAGESETTVMLLSGVQIVGALVIFVFIPPLMVRVWDTVPIPPGELRDELEKLARLHRVRVRDFLIWRTGGAMLNGAVIGLTPWLRYIILTDALLDHLPAIEVEAVAAHEVAHVRKKHMIWLAVSVLGAAMLLGEVVVYTSIWWRIGPTISVWLGAAASLVGVLLVLGAVSRRFEWQADAFAARHISEAVDDAVVVTPDAAGAMSEALGRVSRLNGMPQEKFTWRHGSIATRRRRLDRLIGQPVDRLGIDRHVRTVLWIAGVCFVAGLALSIAGMLQLGPYASG